MLRYIIHILLLTFYYASANFSISGAPKHIQNNVEKRLQYKMRQLNNLSITEQLTDQIEHEVTEATKPFGYFRPSTSVTTDETGDISIKIDLNSQAYFHQISTLYPTETADASLKLQIQHTVANYRFTPFTLNDLNTLTNHIKATAVTNGYTSALVSREHASYDPITNQVNITFRITPNKINTYGKIITENMAHAKCLKRYHNIQEGEKFNDGKRREFQKNMLNSGLFRYANISTVSRKFQPDIKDIIVEYLYNKPVQLFFGVGIESNLDNDKFSPNAQLNIRLNNLGGCGIYLNSLIKSSSNNSQIASELIIPSPSGPNDFSSIGFNFNSDLTKDEDNSKLWQVSAMMQRQLFALEHQLSGNITIEESTLNDNRTYITQLAYPEYNINGRLNKKSYFIQLQSSFKGGLESLGSDLNFFQGFLDFNSQFNFKRLILRSQLSVGKIWTSSFSLYPLSMQYTLGGPDSNRGMERHQIDEGNSLILNRNSIQVQTLKSLYVGLFLDAGSCINDENATHNSFHPSNGLLFSYITGLGNFELSIGREADSQTWIFHISAEPGEDLL